MIIPNSIPAWYKITNDAKKYNLQININVDPFSGKQSGHMFYKGKAYYFQLEVYKKNMLLSLKENNDDIFNIWNLLIEEKYKILYQAPTDYPVHAEWYFDVTEEEIDREIKRMISTPVIDILKINN